MVRPWGCFNFLKIFFFSSLFVILSFLSETICLGQHDTFSSLGFVHNERSILSGCVGTLLAGARADVCGNALGMTAGQCV